MLNFYPLVLLVLNRINVATIWNFDPNYSLPNVTQVSLPKKYQIVATRLRFSTEEYLTALTPLISKTQRNRTVPELFDSVVERGSFRVKVAVLIAWVFLLNPIVQVHLLPLLLPYSDLLMLTLHDL